MQLCINWMEANLEYGWRLTGAPFITVLDSTGKRFKEFDYPREETGPIECTIVIQLPVITVNALAALLWCEGNPMLRAMGNPMYGGDLLAIFFFCSSAIWPRWPGR